MKDHFDKYFEGLPYGFSSFINVKDSLFDVRAKSRIPAEAKTVISVLFPYYLGEDFYKGSNISRYAVPADYHIYCGNILDGICKALKNDFPKNEFEYFVDNSPLPEVRCAVNAGLGFVGKNSLFISEKYGSWVFLGEIITDIETEFQPPVFSPCIGCGKCINACPTGAINESGIEREKCLSYLSQKKGELPDSVKEKMNKTGCVWGCDICQKVCPYNKKAEITPIGYFRETAIPSAAAGLDITNRAFAWRGEKVINRNINAVKK